MTSLAVELAALPVGEREAMLAELSPADRERLVHDWRFRGRPEQLPPTGGWRWWLILTGRGWGKTRTASEWIRVEARTSGRLAVVGATAADVRDVMIEGESGLLAVSPRWERPLYEPSKRRLTWPNGAIAGVFSADEPDRLRGPQFHRAWCDELAVWRYPEAFENLELGLRLGVNPRGIVVTTPRRVAIVKSLVSDPEVVVTRGSTYDNRDHLAPSALRRYEARYGGTRLGRQELGGELLEDVEGALWSRDQIDASRVRRVPDLVRVVVAIDPAVTSEEGSDETGIVVVGRSAEGDGYVVDDLSGRMPPERWASRAVEAYHRYGADRIVAEGNQGGDLVESTLRAVDAQVAYRKVHASRGKVARAEPIAALYEQGRVHHLGTLAHLEDQMCEWEQGQASPDRVDALVWALTELMLGSEAEPRMRSL